MKSNEIVKAIMKNDQLSQMALAEKMGYSHQSGVGNALQRENKISVEMFLNMLNTMGYDLVVRRGKDEMVVTK